MNNYKVIKVCRTLYATFIHKKFCDGGGCIEFKQNNLQKILSKICGRRVL